MIAKKHFGKWEFELLGPIDPECGPDGAILALMPQSRLKNASASELHAYGAGPFCRFKVGRKKTEAGLYVLTMNGLPIYAGECAHVGKRWGPNGYGGISPRNCFRGGQQTNCRINNAIMVEALKGASFALWFVALDGSQDERRDAETELIRALRPSWNKAKMK